MKAFLVQAWWDNGENLVLLAGRVALADREKEARDFAEEDGFNTLPKELEIEIMVQEEEIKKAFSFVHSPLIAPFALNKSKG